MQYFGSKIGEGDAESWVEAKMSWVEVGGGWNELGGSGWSWVEAGARFSNTHIFYSEYSPSSKEMHDSQKK